MFISIVITSYYFFFIIPSKPQIAFSGTDKFGIKEILQTKNGGREWFIDMDNPIKDHLFSITDDAPLKRNIKDGSWLINE